MRQVTESELRRVERLHTTFYCLTLVLSIGAASLVAYVGI